MNRLSALHAEHGQSPWLDNLKRSWIEDGTIAAYVERGVRGITSNPSIFQNAIQHSADYDTQFEGLVGAGLTCEDAYWQLVLDDIRHALEILAPVHESSDGTDGFVSVEVSPRLANDEAGTVTAARGLDKRIDEPNLYVKVPATAAGVGAIRQLIGEGRSINVTLIFSLERYEEVMEAYISGLESREGDLSDVSSVASFFISRVDTEIDRRLEEIGTPEALALRGRAAVAQGQLAYERFLHKFSGPRWEALAARGARLQRPLWASTSTKNPEYPDTLYVDTLIGPNTVNTLPDATLEAFDDHGTLARTVDDDIAAAHRVWGEIGDLVDLADVSEVLEEQGVAAFVRAFDELLEALHAKADELDD